MQINQNISPFFFPGPDISRIACCDRGYERPSGRPRVSDPATYCKVRLGSNPLRLPGGTPFSTVSRHQFVKYPGQGKITGRTCTICSDWFHHKSLRVRDPGPKDPAILDLKAQCLEARDVLPVQSAISNLKSSIIHRLARSTRFSMLNEVLDLNGS